MKLKNSTYADELTETKCLCLNGFTGDHCEINVDDCLNNRCAAGSTCIDGVGKYTCKCPPGKLGLLCQLDDPCTAKPCKSNSECIVNTASGEFECRCRKGFTGPDCSEDINECALVSESKLVNLL
ncbi:unnamed protein product [Anisakis simplex]|uniref:EGF-like domain-containing protein n=1 Tax=Anisakis simplex TaxID=6269 RepID=A0A3P6PBD7_ANISI|nr:unnamed protein product [Anisakis simplex]